MSRNGEHMMRNGESAMPVQQMHIGRMNQMTHMGQPGMSPTNQMGLVNREIPQAAMGQMGQASPVGHMGPMREAREMAQINQMAQAPDSSMAGHQVMRQRICGMLKFLIILVVTLISGSIQSDGPA